MGCRPAGRASINVRMDPSPPCCCSCAETAGSHRPRPETWSRWTDGTDSFVCVRVCVQGSPGFLLCCTVTWPPVLAAPRDRIWNVRGPACGALQGGELGPSPGSRPAPPPTATPQGALGRARLLCPEWAVAPPSAQAEPVGKPPRGTPPT